MIEPEKEKAEEAAVLPKADPYLAVAEQLHELFLEYRDDHGCDEETAWAKACCEYMDAKGV